MLLFLKSVEYVDWSVWHADAATATLIHSVSLSICKRTPAGFVGSQKQSQTSRNFLSLLESPQKDDVESTDFFEFNTVSESGDKQNELWLVRLSFVFKHLIFICIVIVFVLLIRFRIVWMHTKPRRSLIKQLHQILFHLSNYYRGLVLLPGSISSSLLQGMSSCRSFSVEGLVMIRFSVAVERTVSFRCLSTLYFPCTSMVILNCRRIVEIFGGAKTWLAS
jgi:hypothetical protein